MIKLADTALWCKKIRQMFRKRDSYFTTHHRFVLLMMFVSSHKLLIQLNLYLFGNFSLCFNILLLQVFYTHSCNLSLDCFVFFFLVLLILAMIKYLNFLHIIKFLGDFCKYLFSKRRPRKRGIKMF